MKEKNRTIPTVVVTLAALNGVFLFGNGLFMLLAPSAWYYFVPGVTHTGPFNQHFIRDIGLIQMFLGAAFGVGMIRPAMAPTQTEAPFKITQLVVLALFIVLGIVAAIRFRPVPAGVLD